jgi:lysophospholipase L1-like esterase
MAAGFSRKRLAFSYAAGSLLFMLLATFCLDFLVLRSLERDGVISSSRWQEADRRIQTGISIKNLADQEDWTWRSVGHPVAIGKVSHPRILFMGDSFVRGSGLLNLNDVHWRQLERELHRRGYRSVEVMAAGISGASTSAQLEKFPDLVKKYHPDLIIWGYVTNDADAGLSPTYDMGLLEEDWLVKLLTPVTRHGPFTRVAFQLKNARTKKLLAENSGPQGYSYESWEHQIVQGQSLSRYRETIDKLVKEMQMLGVPGFMVNLPNNPDAARWEGLYEPVEQLAAESGLKFYNILDRFVDWSSELPRKEIGFWRANPANGHPGPGSGYFFSTEIADILERDYLQALGSKESPTPGRPRLNDWWPPTMVLERAEDGWSFDYPTSEYHFNSPGLEPAILFFLAEPFPLQEVRIEGETLQNATIAVTAINSGLGFDPGTIVASSDGTALTLQGQLVNAIVLRADVTTSNPRLTLHLK